MALTASRANTPRIDIVAHVCTWLANYPALTRVLGHQLEGVETGDARVAVGGNTAVRGYVMGRRRVANRLVL